MTIRVFKSTARSILDYGAIVYNFASGTNLKSFETITTDALRIASGAFNTIPINSLYILYRVIPCMSSGPEVPARPPQILLKIYTLVA